MAKKNKNRTAVNTVSVGEYIHCACLIHDVAYDWCYVENLYRSLCRNLTPKVTLHVYTEKNRPVPAPFVKHDLQEWPGIRGPKRSWWYKIQLFNPRHHQGPMLYFDLDTVITGNIDWIWQLPLNRFWAVQDFKYLWRSNRVTINSSVMWFDPTMWSHIYQSFDPQEVVMNRRWHGDQDFIHENLPPEKIGYFDRARVKSWRWQLLDGGYDFKSRRHLVPGTGTALDTETSVMIFHGNPKPHQIQDPVILQHWN